MFLQHRSTQHPTATVQLPVQNNSPNPDPSGFILEGTNDWELPECLLGAMRLSHLDLESARPLDMSKEIPLRAK